MRFLGNHQQARVTQSYRDVGSRLVMLFLSVSWLLLSTVGVILALVIMVKSLQAKPIILTSVIDLVNLDCMISYTYSISITNVGHIVVLLFRIEIPKTLVQGLGWMIQASCYITALYLCSGIVLQYLCVKLKRTDLDDDLGPKLVWLIRLVNIGISLMVCGILAWVGGTPYGITMLISHQKAEEEGEDLLGPTFDLWMLSQIVIVNVGLRYLIFRASRDLEASDSLMDLLQSMGQRSKAVVIVVVLVIFVQYFITFEEGHEDLSLLCLRTTLSGIVFPYVNLALNKWHMKYLKSVVHVRFCCQNRVDVVCG